MCGGGRYDSLIENFGKEMSAVGIAISVNRVLSALIRQEKEIDTPKTDALIMINSDISLAYEVSTKLRNAGLIIENYYGESEAEAIIDAKGKGIDAVISVCGSDIRVSKESGVYTIKSDDIAEGIKI